MGAGERRGSRRAALAGTLLASVGLALIYGPLTPRGLLADEPAHTAYAAEIRAGRLPDLNTVRPEQGVGAGETIYVASHPLYFAAVQGAISAGLDGLGVAEDAELAVGRALNAICTMLTVIVVAKCATEVAGDDRGVFGGRPVRSHPRTVVTVHLRLQRRWRRASRNDGGLGRSVRVETSDPPVGAVAGAVPLRCVAQAEPWRSSWVSSSH